MLSWWDAVYCDVVVLQCCGVALLWCCDEIIKWWRDSAKLRCVWYCGVTISWWSDDVMKCEVILSWWKSGEKFQKLIKNRPCRYSFMVPVNIWSNLLYSNSIHPTTIKYRTHRAIDHLTTGWSSFSTKMPKSGCYISALFGKSDFLMRD